MDRGRPTRLVVLQGGRTPGAPRRHLAARPGLRVIPGGPAGDLLASIEVTFDAGRRIRREIEERIARALEDPLRAGDPPALRRRPGGPALHPPGSPVKPDG
jgi:hypothetical protein